MKKLPLIFCALLVSAMTLFTVSVAAENNSYVRGDADGDGIVDIGDATLIQLVLAEKEADPNGQIAMRAHVDLEHNELTIKDVTYIQLYLAELDNPYDIGEVVDVTEPVTEPQTEKPTQSTSAVFITDPYELPFVPV